MWAKWRALYQIQAPTTAQKNGQGLTSMRAAKARGLLFFKVRIVFPTVFIFDLVLN
jgi:hypothetical protein